MKRLVAALVAWGFAVGSQAVAAPPPADMPAAAALLDAVKADLKRASALYTESGDYVGVLAACRLALTKLDAYRPEWGDQARARSYGARAQLLSGFAEEKSGHVREAIAAYRTYLERYPEAPAESRQEATTSLGQLALLGFLMPQLTPTNAVIEVDGASSTRTRRDESRSRRAVMPSSFARPPIGRAASSSRSPRAKTSRSPSRWPPTAGTRRPPGRPSASAARRSRPASCASSSPSGTTTKSRAPRSTASSLSAAR